ncbi:MAG: DNA-processing protein DprA [Deltaproteobacteria bacterium]|nr:DNA-processing protein DprA [Deltaproteobacteria bacterium]
MSKEDIQYWLALKFIDELGSVGIKNLIDVYGSPKAVFTAPENDLVTVQRISKKLARRITEFDNWEKVERELELAAAADVSVISVQDPSYPQALLNIYDFPPVLYVKGALSGEDINVAVIGSRMASTYGKFMTERLCRELALSGITVVSGMARGIDSAAHRGSLTGKGRTIAVLGSGVDVIYPPENKKLYEKIWKNGAVISEFPFRTQPKGSHFPARNRIISGLSLGVVVVEATERSGSLITARLGLEQGKEVFAVPGSIDSPGSKGTHKLLKEGAKLVESVYDILEEIIPQVPVNLQVRTSEKKDASGKQSGVSTRMSHHGDVDRLREEEKTILKIIGKEPIYADNIIAMSSFPPSGVLRILLSLELEGYIEQLPGKRFKIKE